MCCDSPPPPDYTPLANASKESAEIMAKLGREQLDFAKSQYHTNLPIYQRIVNAQLAAQDETQQQGREYYQYLKDTYRPLEQGMVRDANAFSTDAYREQLASNAAADSARAFGNTQAMTARNMASMGANPASGRYASVANQNALGLAASRANAMTGTRQQAEQMGWAKRMDAAGLGRNLPGASQGAYGAAIGAGNAAGANQSAPGAQYMQGMAQGNSTIGSGQSMYLQGLGNVLSAQTSYANAVADSPGIMGGLGSLLGGGAAMSNAGMFAGFSDRRLKEHIELVGVDEATGLSLYEFCYLEQPQRRYRGVMADEVEAVCPEAVSYDETGYAMVDYAKLGIPFEEVAPAQV